MGILDISAQPIVLKITLHENGALSVEGPIDDKKFCLALLDSARDAVRNHGRKGLVTPEGTGFMVPAKDVQ